LAGAAAADARRRTQASTRREPPLPRRERGEERDRRAARPQRRRGPPHQRRLRSVLAAGARLPAQARGLHPPGFHRTRSCAARSLTKLWSLAGIRAGYLLAPAEMVERLAANRQPWSVNILACAALTTCATDHDTPRHVAASVAVAREELADAMQLLPGVRIWPS